MATEKQFAANRANAQLSTGPNTEAGRSTSSRNATVHGLSAKAFIIPPGKEVDFAQLESGLRSSLQPGTPLQEVIFKRIVDCAWKLERCLFAEHDLGRVYGSATYEPLGDPVGINRLAAIQKYAREAENSMFKSIRELGKLQTESQFRQELVPVTEAQLNDPEQVKNTPHARSEAVNFHQIVKTIAAKYRNEAKARNSQQKAELDAILAMSSDEILRFEANLPPAPKAFAAA